MKNDKTKFQWETNFPAIFKHTSISFLKRCEGFYLAKCGDLEAARDVVYRCVKPKIIEQLCQMYPNAVTIPVISSTNKLPLAYAQTIGLKINSDIRIISNSKRKHLCGMQRLLDTPHFVGEIKPNQAYILVDDIIAQGGTMTALRRHVLEKGGTVCAVTTLANSAGKGGISPDFNEISLLKSKYGAKLLEFLQLNDVVSNLHELTYSQARYLLSFNQPSHLLSMLKKYSNFK